MAKLDHTKANSRKARRYKQHDHLGVEPERKKSWKLDEWKARKALEQAEWERKNK